MNRDLLLVGRALPSDTDHRAAAGVSKVDQAAGCFGTQNAGLPVQPPAKGTDLTLLLQPHQDQGAQAQFHRLAFAACPEGQGRLKFSLIPLQRLDPAPAEHPVDVVGHGHQSSPDGAEAIGPQQVEAQGAQ